MNFRKKKDFFVKRRKQFIIISLAGFWRLSETNVFIGGPSKQVIMPDIIGGPPKQRGLF